MATDPFRDLEVPIELQASVQRHRAHQAQLEISLRSAGVAEAQIERSVSLVGDSYKKQLVLAMRRLGDV